MSCFVVSGQEAEIHRLSLIYQDPLQFTVSPLYFAITLIAKPQKLSISPQFINRNVATGELRLEIERQSLVRYIVHLRGCIIIIIIIVGPVA